MAKIFDRVRAGIHENAERIAQGKVNYIPFGLDRFEEAIPGLQRKNYVIVTANSGIAKSKLTKNLYVIKPVDFVLANPHLGIHLKIPYFCLEESKEAFIHSITCHKLYEQFGMRVPIKTLQSRRRELPREIREKVDALDPYFEQFEQIVEVIDDIRYPYGIFQHVAEYMESIGTWTKKTIRIWDKSIGEKGDYRMAVVNDYYVPNNPDTYVVPITDHYAKLYQPKGKTLHETISEFSSKYQCELRDRYYCSPVGVQQQAADQEKKQYTYTGQSIITKLEPSLDGLGDNKLTQRDADEIIGIFAPDRYEIPEHRKYNITLLQDNYRGIIQLKARDGEPNTRIGLFFDGAVNHFEELPPATEMTPVKYDYYLRKVGRGTVVGPNQETFNFGRNGSN